MPRDGSGVPQRHPDDIAVTNDPILAAKHNTAQADMITMLGDVPTRSGVLGFLGPVEGVAGTTSASLTTKAQMDAAVAAAIVAATPARQERVFLKLDAATTLSQPTCTYSIVSNVITVTKAAHGHRIGHRVYVSGTSGGFNGEEAIITITSMTTDTFTGALTHANASGNGLLGYYSMASQLNVHSVCSLDNATDSIYVNYSIDAPSTAVQMFNGSASDGTINSAIYGVSYMGDPTISSWRFQIASSTTGVLSVDCRIAISW